MTGALPPLAALLVSGGDERLDLNAAGLNRYGYGPTARPDDLSFSSSTASSISADAYGWLEQYHAALADHVARFGAAKAHDAAAEAVRAGIATCIGMQGDPPAIVLAASGTDIHLIAAAMLAPPDRVTMMFTMSEHETGSGVGAAVTGHHFANRTSAGRAVNANGRALAQRIGQLVLPARTVDGEPRAPERVAQELESHIAEAICNGQHCVLIVTDVSKTGLLFPSLETVLNLKHRFGERLDILVDACQLRISPATIRAYLAQGFPVAITGSKFLGGPIFCGALLLPEQKAPRSDWQVNAGVLGGYCNRSGWPTSWAGRDALPEENNFGLILRWHAALYEWRQSASVSTARIEPVKRALATRILRSLSNIEGLDPLVAPAMDRSCIYTSSTTDAAADAMPTIFPFRLRTSARQDGAFLSVAECRRIYDALAHPDASRPAIRLGQPVAVGVVDGTQVGALRLCINASQVAQACRAAGRIAHLADQARLALSYVAAEIRNGTGGAERSVA